MALPRGVPYLGANGERRRREACTCPEVTDRSDGLREPNIRLKSGELSHASLKMNAVHMRKGYIAPVTMLLL